MININQICVVGLGYVGLPLAALLTKNNIKVLGVDTNTKVVNNLNKNKIILEEQKLEKIIKKAISKKLLKASLTPEQSCIFILAVPTPIDKQLKPNISYLLKAAKSIAPFLKKRKSYYYRINYSCWNNFKNFNAAKDLEKRFNFSK